jgi:hypothetical protein
VGAESGQAAVEWVGLMLLVALMGAASLAAAPTVDGRSFGGFLTHRIVCAVRSGGCRDGDAALAASYGASTASLVREHAPGLVYEPGERELPVDYRRCRDPDCANAADDPDLDAHRSAAGARSTVFTRVVRRGGRTYAQYWFYYPDSNSTWAGSDRIWKSSALLQAGGWILRGTTAYPGFHKDDWEGYQVRIDADGRAWARATAHGHYQGCKQRLCHNRWITPTGWTRVSRGSHAGHIPVRLRWPRHRRPDQVRPAPSPGFQPLLPGMDLHERTSSAEGLRLVPLESRAHGGYRPQDSAVTPPWRKKVYREPASDRS